MNHHNISEMTSGTVPFENISENKLIWFNPAVSDANIPINKPYVR